MKYLILVLFLFSVQLANGQQQNNDPEHLRSLFAFMKQKEFKNRYTPRDIPYTKSTEMIDGLFSRNPTTKKRAEEMSWTIEDIQDPSKKERNTRWVIKFITQCPKEEMANILGIVKPKLAIMALSVIDDPVTVCDIMYYIDEKSYDKIGPKLPGTDKVSSDYK